MSGKIHIFYRYKEYDDPELTEISRSRGQSLGVVNDFLFWIWLAAFGASIFHIKNNVPEGILYIVGCIAFALLYTLVFMPMYDKHTEKIIAKHVEFKKETNARRIKAEQERKEKASKALDDHDVNYLISQNMNKVWSSRDNIKKSLFDHQKWLSNPADGKRLNLFAEEISGVKLRGMTIEKAIFSHCRFYKLDLEGTVFKDCNLFHSQFVKCKTENTTFPGSSLEGVEMKD